MGRRPALVCGGAAAYSRAIGVAPAGGASAAALQYYTQPSRFVGEGVTAGDMFCASGSSSSESS